MADQTRALQSAIRNSRKFPFFETLIEKQVFEFLSRGLAVLRQFRPPGLRVHSFDFCIPGSRTLVEVDGCYWHSCPIHYPGQRPTQEARDRYYDARATELGWNVVRIWEHEVQALDFSKLAPLVGEA